MVEQINLGQAIGLGQQLYKQHQQDEQRKQQQEQQQAKQANAQGGAPGGMPESSGGHPPTPFKEVTLPPDDSIGLQARNTGAFGDAVVTIKQDTTIVALGHPGAAKDTLVTAQVIHGADGTPDAVLTVQDLTKPDAKPIVKHNSPLAQTISDLGTQASANRLLGNLEADGLAATAREAAQVATGRATIGISTATPAAGLPLQSAQDGSLEATGTGAFGTASVLVNHDGSTRVVLANGMGVTGARGMETIQDTNGNVIGAPHGDDMVNALTAYAKAATQNGKQLGGLQLEVLTAEAEVMASASGAPGTTPATRPPAASLTGDAPAPTKKGSVR